MHNKSIDYWTFYGLGMDLLWTCYGLDYVISI
jgi:hypothetical protein